jgi:hypothetical protein
MAALTHLLKQGRICVRLRLVQHPPTRTVHSVWLAAHDRGGQIVCPRRVAAKVLCEVRERRLKHLLTNHQQ